MKNLLTTIVLLLFVCIAPLSVCHADTFKGKVVNAETGEPLVGANINSEINHSRVGRCKILLRPTALVASISIVVGKAE